MDSLVVWLVVAYLAGVVVSILFPYFLAWLQTKEPFDWRMNVGRVLVALMGILPTLAVAEFVAQLSAAGYFGAFVLGLGFSEIGRMAQKSGAVLIDRN